jgi:NAD(P)-dependent dehydrogenase (short-subunit alcohol dehydrogenase family)
VASQFVAPEQTAAYHVAKAALVQLARYHAVRLGPRGIRVNLVSPAAMVKRESRPSSRAWVAAQRKAIPLGRAPSADEVAAGVLFLCGSGAAMITGQDLVIDGGLTLVTHESLARLLTPVSPRQRRIGRA